jgi:flagellar biogenesis protein FliO
MSTVPDQYLGPGNPPAAISSRFSSPLVANCAGLLRAIFARVSRSCATQESSLRIEERLNLGPKKALLLVNCHGRRFLVATAGDTIAPLIEVDPCDEKTTRKAERPVRLRRERGQ